MNHDEKAIRGAIAAWMKASKAGDLDTLLSFLADDVLFLGAGRAPFGKREFAAQPAGKPFKFKGRADVKEVAVNGAWAYTRCELKVSIIVTKGGPEMNLAGPTLSLWRKRRGRWMIARDANMLTPAAGA